VVHAAAGAMEDIKLRADFEVYFKKFLQSLNLILPQEAGHVYRGPARRFGYLLRMVKERYKDESIDISDAGAKVRALINEHLIDLGINPKIPPIELLSLDFLEHVRKLSGGDPEVKASDPPMGSDDSGTRALVGSQFVLARDVEFSCAASFNLRQLEWVGERVPLTRTRIQAAHGTVPLKCVGNTLPTRAGILCRPALGVQRCRLLPTSATRAPEATPN